MIQSIAVEIKLAAVGNLVSRIPPEGKIIHTSWKLSHITSIYEDTISDRSAIEIAYMWIRVRISCVLRGRWIAFLQKYAALTEPILMHFGVTLILSPACLWNSFPTCNAMQCAALADHFPAWGVSGVLGMRSKWGVWWGRTNERGRMSIEEWGWGYDAANVRYGDRWAQCMDCT